MAPRRGAAAEPVEEEEPQLTALVFDEPLSWRAGKAIPTTDLLRRLDTLSKELRSMDQELVDKDSLTNVAKELVGQNLIGHKDRGVRAFTACCLVDILSLCAPDAPFTPSQTKDIFTLFITSILPVLSDPTNAYNTEHMYVLTSLSEVKSIVLLTDVPNAEPLILHLFSSFFDIISGASKSSTGEQVSRNVEIQMNNLLVTVVDEAASLPSMVIDIIIAQFLRAATGAGNGKQNGEVADEKQSTLIAKELPPAYRMAEHICTACPEKMSRYISQYFNDVILGASGLNGKPSKSHDHRRSSITADSDDEEGPSGPTETDLRELHKAHKLLKELWRASPNVLQNVIPQLDAELSAENIQLRLLATETLGDIISGIGAAGPPPPPVLDAAAWPVLNLSQPEPIVPGNILTTPKSPETFAQTHPAVYHNFIARKNDKSPIIRSAWTTAIGRILTTAAGGIGLNREDEATLVKGLAEKLNDSDERVRLAAVKAVGGFSFREVMTKLAPNGDVNKSGSLLCSLADRARDRKHAVRVEGMTTISKIWGVGAGEIAAGNETVIAALSAIPSKIFDTFYANDQDVNVLLDHVMFEQLIPLSYPTLKGKAKQSNGDSQVANGDEAFDADRIRTERILLLIRSLDPKAKKAFFAMQARQTSFRNVIVQFLKKCEEHNGGVMDENAKEIKAKLTAIIEWLVSMLPDKLRATADLWKYAKLHDRRSYQLIRFAMAPESDFKTVFKAIKEFSKRIEAAPGAPAGLLDTLIPLIFRCGSLVYNKSHLPAILELSRSDAKGLAATAHEVLKEISERNPEVFKAQVKELCKTLEDQAPSATKSNDLGSVETLKACAGYARKYPEEIPHDRKFVQALLSFAQYGTPPKAAKYAVTILMAASERKEMHAKDLLQKVTKDWEYGSDHFLTKLATMSQLTYLEPKVTDEANDEILDITTQQVLLQIRAEAQNDDPKWQDDSSLDEECQAKCWALKVLVNRIRSIKDEEDIKELSGPVYKLLNTLIFKEGEISKTQTTPKHHRSRLRLVAARLMLKLCATSRVFDDLLTPTHFVHLACVTQDERLQVRRGFIEKLQKYLVSSRLSHRFYTIIFLVAFEPEISFRQNVVTWVRSRTKFFQDASKTVMESLLPRLLSLLAHHPDYSPEPEDLLDTAHYIVFYISTVANEENLGLIYKYAERVKQTKDVIKPSESENLYVLSDLTQAVIRKWQDKKGWNMQTYPGKTGLSKDLFAALPSHEVAQEIAERQYIPEEMDDLLDGLIKSADKKKQPKRKPEDEATSQPSAKKPRPSTSSVSKPKASKPLPVRPAKTPKTPKPKTPAKIKKPRKSSATPSSAATASERRRSGRGAVAGKSYADRDSSEDEAEMMDGVSKWEYDDGRVEPDGPESGSDDEEMDDVSAEEQEEPEEGGSSEPEVEVEAEEQEEEDDADEEEKEPTPPPTKTNGKGKRGAAAKAKSTPVKPDAVPKAKAKSTPKSATPKAATKVSKKEVTKPTSAAKATGRPTRGRGKKEEVEDEGDSE